MHSICMLLLVLVITTLIGSLVSVEAAVIPRQDRGGGRRGGGNRDGDDGGGSRGGRGRGGRGRGGKGAKCKKKGSGGSSVLPAADNGNGGAGDTNVPQVSGTVNDGAATSSGVAPTGAAPAASTGVPENQDDGPETSTGTSNTSAPTSDTTATAAGSWYIPTPGTSFLWSLESDIPANPSGQGGVSLDGLQVYDVDLFSTSPEQNQEYKSAGKKVVCYFSAGSYEDGRNDSGTFDQGCYCNKGDTCKMEGWEEWWLDLHTPACVSNIQGIMKARLELAKTNGCDAVEPDNTDSYTNKPGWETTIDDQLKYLQFLSTTAHGLGLGISLKNGPDMIQNKPEIVSLTDFVVVEQCQEYNECGVYSAFVDAGKAAFQVEYESSLECSSILPGFFALSYSSYNVDYKNVRSFCPKA